MAESILSPVSLFEIASSLEGEAGHLHAGISLMRDTMEVRINNPDEVAAALAKLYFLVEGISAVAARLDDINSAVYAAHAMEKAAA